MSFVETRLNDGLIIYGTEGGPEFSTSVVTVASGREFRNENWPEARGRWDVGERVVTETELADLLAFFRVMGGRARGFRWRDWGDYQVAAAAGRLGTGAIGTGYPAYDLYKRYTVAATHHDRRIRKPVAGQVTVYRNGVAVTQGAGAGQCAVDTAAGTVTFVADSSKAVTSISRANPAVASVTGHGFTNGKVVHFSGVSGLAVGGVSLVNGLVFTVAAATADAFQLQGLDSSTATSDGSGGTASLFPQPADALTWAGEFDLPVRFDADRVRHRFEAMQGAQRLFWLLSLPVVEVRV